MSSCRVGPGEWGVFWLGGSSPVELARVVAYHRATDRAPEAVTIVREFNRREVRVPCSNVYPQRMRAELEDMRTEWDAIETAEAEATGEWVSRRVKFPRVSRG